MNDTIIGFDQADEEILASEVSDEALETAASISDHRVANFTLAFCSGLSTCPA